MIEKKFYTGDGFSIKKRNWNHKKEKQEKKRTYKTVQKTYYRLFHKNQARMFLIFPEITTQSYRQINPKIPPMILALIWSLLRSSS